MKKQTYQNAFYDGQKKLLKQLVFENIITPEIAEKKLNEIELLETTMDIKFGGRPTKYSAELAEELSKKYNTMLITDLAREYNVSEVTMHRWLRRAGLAKYNKNGGNNMVLANTNQFTLNIKYLQEREPDMVLLYFTGSTYGKKEIIKNLGFGYTNHDSEEKYWQLLIQLSNLSEKLDLIKKHFPDITIIFQELQL